MNSSLFKQLLAANARQSTEAQVAGRRRTRLTACSHMSTGGCSMEQRYGTFGRPASLSRPRLTGSRSGFRCAYFNLRALVLSQARFSGPPDTDM